MAVLAVFGLAASIVFAATGTGAKAKAPREMRYACALKSNGMLRYASKPSACNRRSEVALDLQASQVQACVLVERFRALPRGARGRLNPAALLAVGTTRRVPRSSLCGRQAYGRELAITLPARNATFFCGVGRSHRLRFVSRASACRRGEMPMVVPAFKPSAPNAPGGNQGNILANDDTGSTGEGAPTDIDVVANDTVPGPGNKRLSVTGVDVAGTQGTVSINPNGTVHYDPNGHFENLNAGQTATDSFRYRATDGPHTSNNAATVRVTINGSNDAPVLAGTESSPLGYVDGMLGLALTSGLTVSDVDNANLHGATVTIATHHDPADQLLFTNISGISGSYNAAAGVLTLTGTATKADYQAALRSVRFASLGAPSGNRRMDFQVDDGSASNGQSNVVSRSVSVDRAPTDISLSPSAVDENKPSGTTVGTLTSTDPDAGDSHTYTFAAGAGDGDNGSFSLDGSTLKTAASFDYEAGATRHVRIKTDDGHGGTFEKALDVTINDVNDPPTATDQSASTAEDQALPITLQGSDPDGNSLTFSHDGSSAHGGTITGSGATVTYTPAADYCGPDSFGFSVDDGNGGTDTGTVSITVNCVNDAPVVDLDNTKSGSGATASFTENSPAAAVAPNADVTDVDDANLESATITLTNHPDGGVESLAVDTTGTSISATGSGGHAITLSGDAPKSEYRAVLRTLTYDNSSDTPDTTDRDVSVKVNDGALDSNTAHATVSVAATNDAPTATDQSVSTDEDHALPIMLAGTDPEGDSLTFAYDQPSHGTVSGTTASVTYTPDPDYCGPDSFTFTADDGHGGTDTGTVDITVNCVNDAPRIDLNGTGPGTSSEATFHEADHSPVAVAPDVRVSDPDGDNLTSATVTLTNRPDGDAMESLSADAGSTGLSVNYVRSTGVLTVSGTRPASDYEAVLHSLTYDNAKASPNPADRTITYTATDEHAAASTAQTATVHVVPINIPPSLDLDNTDPSNDSSASFAEDGPPAVLAPNAEVTDADDANMESATITLTSRPDGSAESLSADHTGFPSGVQIHPYDPSTGVLLLTGSDTKANYDEALRRIRYSNSSDTPDTTERSVSVVVNDGQSDSPTRTATVHVSSTNDPITNSVPGAQTFDEDTPQTFSAANSNAITVSDADAGSGDVSVTLSVAHGTLTLGSTSGITPSGNGTATVQATGTVAHLNAALDGTTYQPDSDFNGSDTLAVESNDNGHSGGPATSDTDTVTLNVSPVNDAPINTVPGAQSVNEDTDLTFSGASLHVFDADADGSGGVQVTLSADHGKLTLNPTPGLSFTTGDGTDDPTMTFTGTTTAVNAALNGLKYRGNQDYNGSDTLTLTTNDQGHTGSGGAKQDQDTVPITVNPVNDAPVAATDTFNSSDSAVGDTTLNVNDTTSYATAADGRMATPDPTDTSPTSDRPHKQITGDILANDTDPDSPSSHFSLTAATDQTTSNGGSVTIESDGDFNYEPPAGCSVSSDSFTYTLHDNDPTNPLTSTGTVNVAISGCVRYVNNDDAEGNSGTSAKPFDTLAQAESASNNGDSIFVYDGDNTSTGYAAGIALKPNQKLIGEAADLVVGSDTLHSADTNNEPTITNNNADVVTLASGNEVRGFNIDPQGTGGGIYGGSPATVNGGTIDNVNITDNGTKGTQPGLELNGTSGTFNVSNIVVNNGDGSAATTGDEGVKLNNAGTVLFDPSGRTSITTNGAAGLDASGTTLGNSQTTGTFDDVTVTNSGNGGVLLNGTSGQTALGDGSGTDLDLTTTQGSTAALKVNNHSGALTVAGAGTDNLGATGGPAADISSTSSGTFSLDAVNSTNSATQGINLSGDGASTFGAQTGTLAGYVGPAIAISGGSGDVTYPGTINDGTGDTASIQNRTGGTVTVSGSINDGGDAGGGISESGNSGGTTDFTGATKTLNTGGSPAISASNPDGSTHTLTFQGGGLNVDTAAGNGIAVSGVGPTADGTFSVSGTGNTIDTGSGTALNVSNASASAAGITFEHISSNGAARGILLNNTGTNNALTVTGSGGTCTAADQSGCTGGVIQNSSGADDSSTTPGGTAVVLKDTRGVSLTRMNLKNNSNYGIRGDNVPGGFTLVNSVVNGTEGSENATSAGTPYDDSAIRFTGLTGSNSITSSAVSGGASNNIAVANSSGSLNRLTIQSSTIGDNSATQGGNAVGIEGTGTATMNVTVDGTSFTGARGEEFDYISGGSAGDLVFTNNTMSQSRNPSTVGTGAGAVRVVNDATANTTMNVASNTITGAKGAAIIIAHENGNGSNGTGTLTGTVNANQIGNPGTANSGSLEGDGIQLNHVGGPGGSSVAITNNQVRQYNGYGIELIAGGSGLPADSGNVAATVTGNTIANPGSNASISSIFQGIQLNSATTPGQSFNWCANIKGNSIVGSGRNTGTDFRLRQRQNTTVRLPGYSGGNTDTSAVTTFMQNQNDANPLDPNPNAPVPTGASLTDAGGGFVGGPACSSG